MIFSFAVIQYIVPVHQYTHTHTDTHTNTHTHTDTQTHTQTHTRTDTHKHTYTHTDTHTHTHTHTQHTHIVVNSWSHLHTAALPYCFLSPVPPQHFSVPTSPLTVQAPPAFVLTPFQTPVMMNNIFTSAHIR